MLPHIAFFTADDRIATEVGPLLSDAGCTCVTKDPNQELWSELPGGSFDLVVADRRQLNPDPVLSVREILALMNPPEIVVLIATDEVLARAELLAAGALAVLSRETPSDELAGALATLAGRAARQRQQQTLAVLESNDPDLADIQSKNGAMSEFLKFVRRVAPSDSSLLLLGETGVGKEYLAKAIHKSSPRGAGPFVPVNCAALSPTLLESELFGHVRGAFTGASNDRRGYFELAHRGTLFLDEVGELGPSLQVKLLRVLQERQVQPVGGEQTVDVDVRLMAATNRDLAREMEEQRFRADLFYRLSVISLRIPPLRSRVEDIPDIVAERLRGDPTASRRGITGVSQQALREMANYPWPGNVRELMNVMERAVLLARGEEICITDLPFAAAGSRESHAAGSTQAFVGERFVAARARVIDEFEDAYLRGLLQRTSGQLTRAAKLADMNPRTLYEKMRRHRLNKEAFRASVAD